MELNPELLDLCTAWQLRPVDGVQTLNDHTDPGYDARVLDLFADLDQRLATGCADLSAHLVASAGTASGSPARSTRPDPGRWTRSRTAPPPTTRCGPSSTRTCWPPSASPGTDRSPVPAVRR